MLLVFLHSHPLITRSFHSKLPSFAMFCPICLTNRSENFKGHSTRWQLCSFIAPNLLLQRLQIGWQQNVFSFSFKPPDEVRAAWKTPPISPVRPPSASRRRDPDPGGASNARGDESSRSTRPGKFVSKLRAEAQLASSGVTSVNRPLHVSNSDSGLSSWSALEATVTTDQGSSGHAARSKSGWVYVRIFGYKYQSSKLLWHNPRLHNSFPLQGIAVCRSQAVMDHETPTTNQGENAILVIF